MRDGDLTSKSKSQHREHSICPVCKRRVNVLQEDPSTLPRFYPFCSERCKLIDLGAWLDAEYRISSKPDDESDTSADEGRSQK
jgi:endogenous inhibitor of DNA gyrase (YacG/DUF329 family)